MIIVRFRMREICLVEYLLQIVINVYLDQKVSVMVLDQERYQQEINIDFLIFTFPVL